MQRPPRGNVERERKCSVTCSTDHEITVSVIQALSNVLQLALIAIQVEHTRNEASPCQLLHFLPNVFEEPGVIR
jgi:hypothetical protein